MVVRYTSTEASLGTGTVPGDPDEVVATTVGRPVPGVELAMVDDDGHDGAERRGRPGPPPVGRGDARLLGRPADRARAPPAWSTTAAATRAVLAADGWLTTGDFGYTDDDGCLHLVGRANELYIRGGYNVYPAEVEAVLGAASRRRPGGGGGGARPGPG